MTSIVKIKNYEKLMNIWLCLLIFLVILIIIVGGLTRLTDSGLSITKWELFQGILPPFTENQWQFYFSEYKKIPQYILINKDISLLEFKVIFYWEYFHRLLGRVVGLTFVVPFIYFFFKKVIYKKYIKSFLIILFLILLQGFIGWFMVESGLTENVSVSHFRLSLHLFTAFIILSSLIWLLFVSSTNKEKSFFYNFSKLSSINFFLFLIYLQIIIGAFVSGLDAGKVYQSWPLMNGSYFPNDMSLKSIFLIDSLSHHGFVQFIHRNVAYIIFINYLYIGYVIFSQKKRFLYKPYTILLLIIFLQILLGISALLSNLDILIASMHQISSIFLVIFSINLYFKSIE